MTSESDNLETFLSWLRNNGAKFDKLLVKQENYSNERCVVCSDHISVKETVLEIPLKLIITSDLAKTETEIARKLWSKKVDKKFHTLKEIIAIVVHLLVTFNQKDYFFSPYYNMLPKSFLNFPFFWNQEQLELLQGSDIVSEIIERREGFREDYNTICSVVPELQELADFDQFCKIRCLVGSRNFGLKINGKKMTTLVPFADMLNHSRPPQTRWTFETSCQAFTIKALTHIMSTHQVFDSYGPKSNNEYLLFYGFVVKNNRDRNGPCRDVVLVNLSLADESEPNNSLKFRMFSSFCYSENLPSSTEMKFDDMFSANFELTKGVGADVLKILTFLRIKHCTESELALLNLKLLSAVGDDDKLFNQLGNLSLSPKLHSSFISLSNELKVLAELSKLCQAALAEYPRSLAENKKILLDFVRTIDRKKSSDYIKEMAFIYIISEQDIYSYWINLNALLVEELYDSEDILSDIHKISTKLELLILKSVDPFIHVYLKSLVLELNSVANNSLAEKPDKLSTSG